LRGRSPAALIAALVSLLVFTNAPALGETPKKLTKLNVVIPGYETNLTPFTITFASSPNTHDLLNLVYDTLFWSETKLSPEPWLAEKADPSPDRKIWTVRLRPGVKWHDGKPFTADDVKFTFDYFKAHAAESGRYGHHVTDFPPYDHAQVLGPTEVKLFFSQPAPSFMIIPGADLPMLPQHIWTRVDKPSNETGPLPIGTGPYKVKKMTEGQGYVLAANRDYFKSKPLVDEINISVNADAAASLNDLNAGKVDLVARTVPAEMVSQLAQNNALRVVTSTREESVQLNFNTLRAPLSDPKLRKAISLAIDNQVLVKTVLGGRGRPGVDGFIHPSSPWAMPDGKHEFDPARANQLLDSAGYTRKDPDGVRKGPNGKRLEFVSLFSNREPDSLKALQLVAQMTTGIGVHLVPRAMAPAQLRLIRRGAPGQVPAYDSYVSGLEAHTHSDPDALYYLFHSPPPPEPAGGSPAAKSLPRGIGAVITGYSSAPFDQLAEQALSAIELNARKQKLYQMQAILGQDVPAIALYYPDGIYSFRPAAYAGWIPDPGQGIFTKRSFLKAYAQPAAIPGEDVAGTVAPQWLFLAGVAGIVVLSSGIVLIVRRPKRGREIAADEPAHEELAEPTVAPAPPAGATAEDDAAAEGPKPEPALPEPALPEPALPEPALPEPALPGEPKMPSWVPTALMSPEPPPRLPDELEISNPELAELEEYSAAIDQEASAGPADEPGVDEFTDPKPGQRPAGDDQPG